MWSEDIPLLQVAPVWLSVHTHVSPSMVFIQVPPLILHVVKSVTFTYICKTSYVINKDLKRSSANLCIENQCLTVALLLLRTVVLLTSAWHRTFTERQSAQNLLNFLYTVTSSCINFLCTFITCRSCKALCAVVGCVFRDVHTYTITSTDRASQHSITIIRGYNLKRMINAWLMVLSSFYARLYIL